MNHAFKAFAALAAAILIEATPAYPEPPSTFHGEPVVRAEYDGIYIIKEHTHGPVFIQSVEMTATERQAFGVWEPKKVIEWKNHLQELLRQEAAQKGEAERREKARLKAEVDQIAANEKKAAANEKKAAADKIHDWVRSYHATNAMRLVSEH